MKICVLTPRFPFPENGGDVLRINNICRYLKKQGHILYLISFVENDKYNLNEASLLYNHIYTIRRNKFTSAKNAIINMICGKPIQCGYYQDKRYESIIKKIYTEEQPDLFIAHLIRVTPYLEKLNLENKTIVEMTDALSKTYKISQNSKGNLLKKIIYRIEKNLINKYEINVINSFAKVVLVSKGDIDYLIKSCNGNYSSIAYHTNGVDILEKPSPNYDNKKICFVGNMRTLQNQDAVLRFVDKILPLILKKIPDVKFYIIGAEPSKRILNLESENIIVTGYVDDIHKAISDSCLAVAPVFVAAGIQNKVLISMGCGVPVVMSTLISKAIPELVSNENCIIEDDSTKIADACVKLINDKEYRNKIGTNGYNMVRNNYSWDEKLKGYTDIIKKQ